MSEIVNEPVETLTTYEEHGIGYVGQPPEPPLYTEEDVVEGFRMVFDEILVLKAGLAEVLRELAELKARS